MTNITTIDEIDWDAWNDRLHAPQECLVDWNVIKVRVLNATLEIGDGQNLVSRMSLYSTPACRHAVHTYTSRGFTVSVVDEVLVGAPVVEGVWDVGADDNHFYRSTRMYDVAQRLYPNARGILAGQAHATMDYFTLGISRFALHWGRPVPQSQR